MEHWDAVENGDFDEREDNLANDRAIVDAARNFVLDLFDSLGQLVLQYHLY